MTTTSIKIGQTVQYNYSDTEVRTGEVVEHDAAANRYRVYWHTAKSNRPGSTWEGHPNKRTWVKAERLEVV